MAKRAASGDAGAGKAGKKARADISTALLHTDALRTLLATPDAAPADFDGFLGALAKSLLCECQLNINGVAYRFEEVEFYLKGQGHSDVFTHCDERQRMHGRWYFHRMGGTYKSGTYKGMDLTFAPGDGRTFGGALIRSIARVDGSAFVEGPCKVVDHILDACGAASIADFVKTWGAEVPPSFDATKPLHVVRLETPRAGAVYRCPRVGLTLKKAKPGSLHSAFIAKNYRFFCQPAALKKGRPNTIVGLYSAGMAAAAIQSIAKSPAASVKKAIDNFKAGKGQDPGVWYGKTFKTPELCQMFGSCAQ